jgi:hypothetical protein
MIQEKFSHKVDDLLKQQPWKSLAEAIAEVAQEVSK